MVPELMKVILPDVPALRFIAKASLVPANAVKLPEFVILIVPKPPAAFVFITGTLLVLTSIVPALLTVVVEAPGAKRTALIAPLASKTPVFVTVSVSPEFSTSVPPLKLFCVALIVVVVACATGQKRKLKIL